MRPARPDRRKGEMAMIIVSTIVSAITAKIVATYYFKKVDGYVKEMCEMTIKSNIPCGKPGTAERSERNIEIYHSSKVHAQDRAVFRMRDPGYYAGTHVWKDGKCCKRRNPHLCGLSAYADTEGV